MGIQWNGVGGGGWTGSYDRNVGDRRQHSIFSNNSVY